MDQALISIIIPVLNEEKLLPALLEYLCTPRPVNYEIIVVDGGSTDQTRDITTNFPVKLISCPVGHRATQMNEGARTALGNILYFLHADALPPTTFLEDILHQTTLGYDFGSFRLLLGHSGYSMLRINSFLTRVGWLIFQGGGDQSLFIQKKCFETIGAFDETYVIMEDFEFVRRARARGLKWTMIDKNIHVSARKYACNNYLKVQIANLLAYSAFKLGVTPPKIKSMYNMLMKN